MYDARGRSNKESLLKQHMVLVRKLAHQLKTKLPANIEVDDLIQTGMIGLMDAMDRYQDFPQAQFETYAVTRIRGAMLDELRSMDWLPRNLRQNMRKIEAAITELTQQVGRPPGEAEVANKLNVSLPTYQKMLTEGAGHQLLYFEDFHNDEDADHFLDRFYADSDSDPLQGLLDHGFRTAVIKAIDALPEREKLLMALYYDQELNLREIGAVLDVTESRVSQMHSQAVARIRSRLREEKWTGAA